MNCLWTQMDRNKTSHKALLDKTVTTGPTGFTTASVKFIKKSDKPLLLPQQEILPSHILLLDMKVTATNSSSSIIFTVILQQQVYVLYICTILFLCLLLLICSIISAPNQILLLLCVTPLCLSFILRGTDKYMVLKQMIVNTLQEAELI